MTHFITEDSTWRVSQISLDGQPLLRIETHDVQNAPVHFDGAHRTGIVTGPGGWMWVKDVTTPAEVAEFVPLDELVEIS
jgi:hypothetical protein